MHQETTALSAGGDRCGHGLFCRFSRERLPTRLNKLSAVCGLVALLGASALYGEELEIVELEAFKVEHHRPTDATLSPLARPVRGLFGGDAEITNLPRSVTVLTPEALRQFGISDYADLDKYTAGTQRINYFGLAGSPFLRGAKAATYFNGIMRAWQRNEMPASFGSVEQLDVVKGPSPAHLSPTLVGGFVNIVPKAPYFDRERYSVELSAGRWDLYGAQVDAGGPFMLGSRPSAYRVSVSGQKADSYYDDVSNDYASAYVSLKTRLRDGLTLSTGGEYFHYRSNENPGWNRPTQELVSQGRYVIGEPADLSGGAWGGTAARTLLEFPFSLAVNPRLHSLAVPGAVARERIPAELRALMVDLNDPAQRDALYTVDPTMPFGPEASAVAQGILDALPKPAQDAYVYTPEYFAAGGEALTAPITGNRTLSDRRDFADAENFLFFFDLDKTDNPDLIIKNQLYAEGLATDKASNYGYASKNTQFVLDDKLTFSMSLPEQRTELTFGTEARFTYAKMLQDFAAEPFSRRDLTLGGISANSTLLAGAATAPDGFNLWSDFAGANLRSHLFQGALFFLGQTEATKRLTLHYGLRMEAAHYRTALPTEVERATQGFRESQRSQGNEYYYLASLSPVFKLTEGVNLYGSVQTGTGIDPASGGVIYGAENFSDTELYEVGIKTALLNGKLVSTLAVYHWDQSLFNERDGESESLRGKGIELETTWQATEKLTLVTAFTAQRVHLRSPTAGFGTLNLTEEEWALYGGILNATSDRSFPNNPENRYPGTPEVSASFFALYRLPMGFSLSGGPIWREAFWHNFDHTIRLPSSLVWNANVGWSNDAWEVMLSVDNVFSEDYYLSAEPAFAGNTLLAKGEPVRWKLTVKKNF